MTGKKGEDVRRNRLDAFGRIIAAALTMLLALSLAACGTPSNDDSGDENFLSGITKMLQAEGRPYNNVTTGKVGDTLTNSFFAWTVHSVSAKNSLTVDGEELLPSVDGYKFVLVEITTKNVFDQANPMGSVDFSIIWGEGDDATEDVTYSEFMPGMYPDDFEEAVGESTSGTLVFEVPGDVNSAFIAYYEIWSDSFEGDTYLFEVTF
jgi:hypothetical protein